MSRSPRVALRPSPYVCPVDGLMLREHPPADPIPCTYDRARDDLLRQTTRHLPIWASASPVLRRAIERARRERGRRVA